MNKKKQSKLKILYITRKKQLWGINTEGVKKCVLQKIKNVSYITYPTQNKKWVTYKNSKLFKKGIKFKFVAKGIKLLTGPNKNDVIPVIKNPKIPNVGTQALNEFNHKSQFRKFAKTEGFKILKEFNPVENKKKFTDADFLCKSNRINTYYNIKKDKIFSVSLKTEGAAFMLYNGGLTYRSQLFQYLPLSEQHRAILETANCEAKKLKKTVLTKKWKDSLSSIKSQIKQIFVKALFQIFSENSVLSSALYEFLNSRKATYKYIGSKFMKNFLLECTNYQVTKVKKDTVQIGIVSLRVKAEGSSVNSSWKVHVDLVKNLKS